MLQIKPNQRNKQVGIWCSWESQGLKFYHQDTNYKKSSYLTHTDVYKNFFIFLLCEAENTAKDQQSDWLSTKPILSRLEGKNTSNFFTGYTWKQLPFNMAMSFSNQLFKFKMLTKLQNPFQLCIITKISFISSQNHIHLLFMRRVLPHASVKHNTVIKTNSYIPTVMPMLESLVRYSSTGPET